MGVKRVPSRAQLADQGDAIHVRHVDVGNHQVDVPLLDDFQSFHPVAGLNDLVATFFETVSD